MLFKVRPGRLRRNKEKDKSCVHWQCQLRITAIKEVPVILLQQTLPCSRRSWKMDRSGTSEVPGSVSVQCSVNVHVHSHSVNTVWIHMCVCLPSATICVQKCQQDTEKLLSREIQSFDGSLQLHCMHIHNSNVQQPTDNIIMCTKKLLKQYNFNLIRLVTCSDTGCLQTRS